LDEYFDGPSRFTPLPKSIVSESPFAMLPPRLQFPMPLSA
jgi:hypothetical protein